MTAQITVGSITRTYRFDEEGQIKADLNEKVSEMLVDFINAQDI